MNKWITTTWVALITLSLCFSYVRCDSEELIDNGEFSDGLNGWNTEGSLEVISSRLTGTGALCAGRGIYGNYDPLTSIGFNSSLTQVFSFDLDVCGSSLPIWDENNYALIIFEFYVEGEDDYVAGISATSLASNEVDTCSGGDYEINGENRGVFYR